MKEENKNNQTNEQEVSAQAAGYRLGAGIDPEYARGKKIRIKSVTVFADAREGMGGLVNASAVKVYYYHPETGDEYYIAGYTLPSFHVNYNQLKEFPRELNIDVELPTTKEEIQIFVEWFSGPKRLAIANCYCNEEL